MASLSLARTKAMRVGDRVARLTKVVMVVGPSINNRFSLSLA